MTVAIVPSSLRQRPAAGSAARFEPRPEVSTVMRGRAMAAKERWRRSDDDGARRAARTRAAGPSLVDGLARLREQRLRARDIRGCDDDDHADAAVEHAMHLRV